MKIKIKPKDGFQVKKPNGDILKSSGESVVSNTYWQRRLMFGEIEICEDKPEKPKKKKPIKKEAVEPEQKKEGEE